MNSHIKAYSFITINILTIHSYNKQMIRIYDYWLCVAPHIFLLREPCFFCVRSFVCSWCFAARWQLVCFPTSTAKSDSYTRIIFYSIWVCVCVRVSVIFSALSATFQFSASFPFPFPFFFVPISMMCTHFLLSDIMHFGMNVFFRCFSSHSILAVNWPNHNKTFWIAVSQYSR